MRRGDGDILELYLDFVLMNYTRTKNAIGAHYKRAAEREQFAEYLWYANVDGQLARLYMAEFVLARCGKS